MSVSPSGTLSNSIAALRALVDASTTFGTAKTWPDEAPGNASLPLAVLANFPAEAWELVAADGFRAQGASLIVLKYACQTNYDTDDSTRWDDKYTACNFFGNVIGDVLNGALTDGSLDIRMVRDLWLGLNDVDKKNSNPRHWIYAAAIFWGDVDGGR